MRYLICAGLVAALLFAASCSNTKAGTKAMVHGTIDSACLIAHKGADLAFGPIEDIQTDATMAVEGAKSLVK